MLKEHNEDCNIDIIFIVLDIFIMVEEKSVYHVYSEYSLWRISKITL